MEPEELLVARPDGHPRRHNARTVETTVGEQHAAGPRLTVSHGYLQNAYRRDSLVIVVLPAFGTLAAIVWAFARGMVAFDLALVVVGYSIAAVGIDIGFHRYFAHRAFAAHRALGVFLAVAGSAAAQGRPIRWVSNHRRHHAYSDANEDPHSPRAGLWHAYVGWIFNHEPSNAVHFARDIIRDPMLALVNRYYLGCLAVGMVVPALAGAAVRGTLAGFVEGVLWGWAVPVFLSQQAAFGVNSFGHWRGRRPFATDDWSRNNPWLAIPSIGAGWQNNHHAFPSAAQTGFEWWELDLGWLLLRVLARVGLVWDLNVPSVEQIRSKRSVR